MGHLHKALKKQSLLWLVWFSWLEHHPIAKGLQVRFLVRAPAWVVGLIPGLDAYRRQPISASLWH